MTAATFVCPLCLNWLPNSEEYDRLERISTAIHVRREAAIAAVISGEPGAIEELRRACIAWDDICAYVGRLPLSLRKKPCECTRSQLKAVA